MPAPQLHTTSFLLLLLLAAAPAWAGVDEFDDERSPPRFVLRSGELSLTLKGELEVELHDIEGEGGPGHDSPSDQRTVGTRSPTVAIDAFWLALRVGIGEPLGVFSVLEFSASGARVGAAWLDLRLDGPSWLTHHLELGLHTPLVKVERHTERYPLVATAFWRQQEFHLSWLGRARVARRAAVELGLWLAMQRPLELAAVQESEQGAGTINILAYGPARAFSGNGPVGGALLAVRAWGASAEIFGSIGRLSAEAGTDTLRSALPNYRDLDGYAGDDPRGGTAWWAGARVGYDDFGVHLRVEGILSAEDLLRRWGGYAQAGYRYSLPGAGPWLTSIGALVRGEVLRIRDGDAVQQSGRALRSTALVNATSWDWEVLTLAQTTEIYRDVLRLRVEYSFIRERNGVPDLAVADVPFRNDELGIQLELRF